MRDDVAAFVNLARETGLGGERVVHAHNRGTGQVAQGAGDAVVSIHVADHPAAAVHVDDKGTLAFPARAVVAHAHLPVASRNHDVLAREHLGASFVPERALLAVGGTHVVEALPGHVRARGKFILLGDDVAHLLGPHGRNVVLVTHEVLLCDVRC